MERRLGLLWQPVAPPLGSPRHTGLMDTCHPRKLGMGMIPPWPTEARTGIVIHLDLAIFWYPEGEERTVPWAPLGQLLYPRSLFGTLLFWLLLSNLMQAQLIAPHFRCHLLGAVQTGDSCGTHLAPDPCDLEA